MLKEGNYRKVQKLSRLLVNDKRTLLYSIKVVTKKNTGKRTAGVDNMIINTDAERMALFYKMCDCKISLHKPKPVRRTYIDKSNGKKRPLGIPTIKDRIYQLICKLALEPIWGATRWFSFSVINSVRFISQSLLCWDFPH